MCEGGGGGGEECYEYITPISFGSLIIIAFCLCQMLTEGIGIMGLQMDWTNWRVIMKGVEAEFQDEALTGYP